MVGARCMICHQWFEEATTSNMNFLYNDELIQGLPVCRNCIFEFYGRHLNYEPIRVRKPKGLERWLK